MYIEHMSSGSTKHNMYEHMVDPAFAPGEEEQAAYATFSAIVRQLRRDCPWDREQTHESVKHLLIEEAYETLAAIDEGDRDGLCEELGDLLLHVAFHGVIAEGDERFSITDIIRKETVKLVRRHPHVFEDTQVEDAEEVVRIGSRSSWRRGQRNRRWRACPASSPPSSGRIASSKKPPGSDSIFRSGAGAWKKVCEEIREFAEVNAPGVSPEEREREFGDVLFALVNYARMSGLNAENALSRTNDTFVRRFRHIEERLAASGPDSRPIGPGGNGCLLGGGEGTGYERGEHG